MKNINHNKYFTLLEKYKNTWSIQAGSYDKRDILDERDYLIDYGINTNDLKIIITNDQQKNIDQAIKKINNTKGSK